MPIHRLKTFDQDSPWPDDRFTGEWVVEWPNGQLKFRAHYLDGKANGDYRCFSEEGRVVQEGRMCRGECVGRWVDYHHDTGSILAERVYLDGHCEGIERSYFDNGNVMSERSHRQSVLHGPFRWFLRDGQLAFEGEYQEGEPWDGVCEVEGFDQQVDGSYSSLAEFRCGSRVRDVPWPE